MEEGSVVLENWTVEIDGHKCYAAFNRYIKPYNVSIELNVVDTHEPYARVTINDGKGRSDDRVLVKDYSENEGLPELLQKAGLLGKHLSNYPYAEYELLLKPATLLSKEDAAKDVRKQ